MSSASSSTPRGPLFPYICQSVQPLWQRSHVGHEEQAVKASKNAPMGLSLSGLARWCLAGLTALGLARKSRRFSQRAIFAASTQSCPVESRLPAPGRGLWTGIHRVWSTSMPFQRFSHGCGECRRRKIKVGDRLG